MNGIISSWKASAQQKKPPTKQVRTIVGEVAEKKESAFTAGENVNWYSHYGKQYGVSSKN